MFGNFNCKNLKGKKTQKNSFVCLKNTANVDGEQVVQLYIRDMVASIARPVKELKGFEKVLIRSGETKHIQFVLTPNELGFYNNEGEFLFEKGLFQVMVGTNSVDVLKQEIEL